MRGKERFEAALAPLAVRIPAGPNWLTLLAVLVMAVAAWFVLQGSFALAALLVIISGFIDMLDGTVAKAQNRASAWGAILDRVGDRISDALIFGSVVIAGLVQLWLGLAVLVLVMLGSYVSACLEAATKTKIGEKLSMRAVRLILLAAALLLAGFVDYPVLDCALSIIALLAIFALAQRLWAARKILKEQRSAKPI